MTNGAVVETVLATYLDRYQERQAASKHGLPFEGWEQNVLVAEIYAVLAEAADSPRARALCLREMDDLSTAAGLRHPLEQQSNALAYLWTRPAAIASTREMPPAAVTRALTQGSTPTALATPSAVFWRVRVLPALRRFARSDQLRDLELELKWWSRRLLILPRLLATGDPPDFTTVAVGGLLQAELAAATGSRELADAARTSIEGVANAARYPPEQLSTADLGRGLLAARTAGIVDVANSWLIELLGARLDLKHGLLHGAAANARHEFSPWVPRGLAATAPSFNHVLDAIARPFSGVQSGIAQ